MQKVDGIQTVTVSLKDGLTILDLKPGNNVTIAALRRVIKNNGFVSKEVQALVRGTPSGSGTDVRFKISGTNEELLLSADPRRTGDNWQIAVRPPGKP
jgi:hypothetical protein